jgi:hypothetical protein
MFFGNAGRFTTNTLIMNDLNIYKNENLFASLPSPAILPQFWIDLAQNN